MSVLPILSLGVLLLAGLFLGIPLLVILLVSPKSRAALASGARFMGWILGCVVLLALLGYFITVPTGHPEQSSPRTVQTTAEHSLFPVATRSTVSGQERAPALSDKPAGSGLALAEVSSVRPDWIDQAPVNRDQTYRVAVKSGLWTTDAECQKAIQGAVVKALDEYVTGIFGDDRATQLVDLDADYLRQHLIKRPLYAETVDASVGTMRQLHALLEFDDDLRVELHRLWQQAAVSHRLRDATGGFALVLAALGTLFAYLRLDLATGGRHRGRLRWASGLAILLVAAGAVGICVL